MKYLYWSKPSYSETTLKTRPTGFSKNFKWLSLLLKLSFYLAHQMFPDFFYFLLTTVRKRFLFSWPERASTTIRTSLWAFSFCWGTYTEDLWYLTPRWLRTVKSVSNFFLVSHSARSILLLLVAPVIAFSMGPLPFPGKMWIHTDWTIPFFYYNRVSSISGRVS